jgi:condensin-2 complex subunit G2
MKCLRQFKCHSDALPHSPFPLLLTRSLTHSLTPLPPKQDPEASTEEQDEMLVRQFQCLSDTLTDPCPLVRVAAAQGICTILNLYWEIIPSATTAGYVSRLTGVCGEGR